ncbi:MarR family winged helix-turn-helix transcriptional regulator [Labilibacter marinus]|uniref:MarR family winged helix-turn-helix transcriptional regulator n=1 Tax=Labilibacter marinus TaxID=1477105 RepID=UPI000835DBD1|nr:MarR family transcriptional regulator [Labilibacter marinus]
MSYDQLKLENQLCFPVYAASRLITREYQPYLDELGITYTQYLVFLILWEKDKLPVNDIAKMLILNTNTVTPLLKRMEQQGFIKRERSKEDERKVIVCLSSKGEAMKEKAAVIPQALANNLLKEDVKVEELIHLKEELERVIKVLSK